MTIRLLDAKVLNPLVYVLLLIVLTYFIGMRGSELGSDTFTYYRYFNFVKYGTTFVGAERVEIGFYWLTKIIAFFTDSEHAYLSIVFLIQFIGITSALYKKNEIFKSYILMTLVWLSFPFFYSLTLNVIRQGLAFVFVVYAIDARLQNKKYEPYFLILFGSLFHYPAVLYLLCLLIMELRLKVSTMLGLWLIATVVALGGWLEGIYRSILIKFISDSSYYFHYINYCEVYETGIKLKFLIFSALPIGYYFLLKQYKSENIERFLFVFGLYLAMNILYLSTVNFPFNDRLAMASWLLMPLMVDWDLFQKLGVLRLFKIMIIFSSILMFSYYIFFLHK